MINKENEKILENVKLKISISNFTEKETIEIKRNNKNIFKITTVACCILVLTTGVVFANFIKYYFGNKTLDKAAESGYVGEINSNVVEKETTLVNDNTGTVVNNINVAVKFDEFLMDDLTLSTNMTFEFDEKIKEVFDLDKLQNLVIEDLIVIDDKNKILINNACKDDFDRLCEKYNLNQTFGVWNENNYNCSSSRNLLDHNKETNTVNYNLSANPSDILFPNSKELTFIFSKIKLEKFEEYIGQDIENGEYLKSNSITLTGDWEFKVEVPEKMYNRTKIEYKVTNVSNPDFEVYTASVSDTGFAFGTIISNVNGDPFAYKFNQIYKQFQSGQLTLEETQKKTKEILNSEEFKEYEKNTPKEDQPKEYIKVWDFNVNKQIINNISHVTNSKGQNFVSAFMISKEEFIESNKYNFFHVFELSKVDATDKLTVTLIYNGEPIYIELEKNK